QGRTAAPARSPAAPGLAARQQAAPAEVVVARDLRMDEAVDGLGADRAAGAATAAARHLFGRPAGLQLPQHPLAQRRIAIQPRAPPAARRRLFMRIDRLVADLPAAIALQLPRDRR